MNSPAVSEDGLATGQPKPSAIVRRSFLSCYRHHPLGVAAAIFLLVVIAASVLAPLLAPYNPNAEDLTSVLSLPSAHHLLGTDELGRDVLSRLLYGGDISLIGVVEVLGVALVVSVPVALFSALRGRTLGAVLDRVADLALAVPPMIVLLMVFSVPGGGENVAMLALGVLSVAPLYRVVRGAALPLREALYVVNAEVSGVSRARILWRHILPGTTGPLIVNASLIAAVTLTVQTGLNFLGLGVQPPAPSWGGMIGEGLTAIQQQAWLLVPPGLLVGLTILALVLVGDASRDALAEKWRLETERTSTPAKPTAQRAAKATDVRHAGALLSVRGLSVITDAAVPITEDISFDVMPGEAVALVGESGCGKSITASAILGLLPPGTRLAAGEAWFEGQPMLRRAGRLARDVPRIGYIAQDPMTSLDPCFTVASQIGEVVRRHGVHGRAAIRERTIALLRSVQVDDAEAVAGRYPHQLSGGLAQRVQIAMALATEPVLIVADEPTTALDVTTQAQILELLRELRQRQHLGLLLITHDWGVVADSCDRAVVMYAGQVAEQGNTKQLVRGPLHPYTKALLLSNPQLSSPGGRLPAIPGSVPVVGGWAEGCRFHPRCPMAGPECRTQPIALRAYPDDRLARCVHSDLVNPPSLRVAVGAGSSAATSPAPLLELTGVTVAYRDRRRLPEHRVLEGISTKVGHGETVAIVGESGSGKTTIAKAILGMVPVMSGVITLADVDITRRPEERRQPRRKGISAVFQDPYRSLSPTRTIQQTLAEPLLVDGRRSRAEVDDMVASMLERVGIGAGARGRYPSEFSGGQRQRIAIARALVLAPDLLICDEPLSALDVSVQAQILNLLADLRDEMSLTCLFISHNIAAVRHFADRVVVLHKGQIVEEGAAELVCEHPVHEYTASLIEAVPDLDPEVQSARRKERLAL